MKQKSVTQRDWVSVLRRLSQFGFAAFILSSSVRHATSLENLPSIDATCPFGGIATLWKFISSGGSIYVQKIHPSNLVMLVGLLVGAIIAGGTFCGWICPLGALQDALDWVRGRLKLRSLRLPRRVDRVLRYGRYVMLAGILYATISTAKLWFADFDPYRTIFGLGWLFEFNWAEHWKAYVSAVAMLAAALLIPRFWCRYLCPLGAILGLLQRISPLKVRRDASLCIRCGKCDAACPMDLSVATVSAVNYDCTGCQKCTGVCPVDGALDVSLGALKPLGASIEEVSR